MTARPLTLIKQRLHSKNGRRSASIRTLSTCTFLGFESHQATIGSSKKTNSTIHSAFSLSLFFLIKMHVRPQNTLYWSLVIARRANCHIRHSRRTQRQYSICRLNFRGATCINVSLGAVRYFLSVFLLFAATGVDARLASAFVCLSFSAWVSIWICVLKCKQSPSSCIPLEGKTIISVLQHTIRRGDCCGFCRILSGFPSSGWR